MPDSPADLAITDHIAGFLLRYFAKAIGVRTDRPYTDVVRDRDLLRLHWAISPVIRDLVTYVLQHRHEIQSVLTTARRIEDSVVRGRLDARATILHRRMTGLSTAMVSKEPLRSFDSGPNQVLSWILTQAWSLASRFASMLPDSASYLEVVEKTVQGLEQVRRIQAIAMMSGQLATKRPASGAVSEAGRSRREVYRKAHNAYESLVRIESGDPKAITDLLRATLLAPLEVWRRYELAVAFSIAEALAIDGPTTLVLNLLVGDTRSPIARVGRFSIFWQSRTALYTDPELEPSELVTRHILDAYGLSASSERPDLVVVDAVAGNVVSVIEVKYLAAEDASDRIRSAVAQLVRYSRLYHLIDEVGPLLGRSLVAVSQGTETITIPSPIPDDVPLIVDFAAIRLGQLAEWVVRLRP
jgi:hypothetical protein